MIIQLDARRDAKMRTDKKYNRDEEAVVIDSFAQYEALSLAWDIEEKTGDAGEGSLQMVEMPRMYRGDLSSRMPLLTEDDLEEIDQPADIAQAEKTINDYNASSKDTRDISDVMPDRPYDGIHDASELEERAKHEELQQMDKDGLYVKLSVDSYDSRGLPRLKATRWDGEELPGEDLMDNISHYVTDMKANKNKVPFDVGEAIMSIDRPQMEAAYGEEGAIRMVNEVLVLMTPEYRRRVA